MVRTLVVDGANVVGARPDGWWRDRAGAARLLRDDLAAAALPYEVVVLVLEGGAKAGVAQAVEGALRVVHAPGHGDDEIVAQAEAAICRGETVTVATSDRALRERIRAAGGAVAPVSSVPRSGRPVRDGRG